MEYRKNSNASLVNIILLIVSILILAACNDENVGPANRTPILTLEKSSESVSISEISSIKTIIGVYNISDADLDAVTVDVKFTKENLSITASDGNLILTKTGNLSAGQIPITLTPSDESVSGEAQIFTLILTENNPTNTAPVLTLLMDSVRLKLENLISPQLILGVFTTNDAEGDSVSISASSSNRSLGVSVKNRNLEFISNGSLNAGLVQITLTPNDGKEDGVSKVFIVDLEEIPVNNVPELTLNFSDGVIKIDSLPLTIENVFGTSDLDGDPVSVSTMSSNSNLGVSASNGSLVLSQNGGLNVGIVQITLTPNDGKEDGVSKIFTVTLEETPINNLPELTLNNGSAVVELDSLPLTIENVFETNDIDGDLVSVSTVSSNANLGVSASDGKLVLTQNGSLSAGLIRVTLTPNDGKADGVSKTFTVLLEENTANPSGQ